MSEDAVIEYSDTLADLSADEVDWAIIQAKKNSDKYVPTPSEVYAIAMEYRERGKDRVLDEMKKWEKSDPNWPEAKEFMALVRSVATNMAAKHKKAEMFIKPVPAQVLYDSRKALVDYYLRQDLMDGQPRSKAEIAAIKATQPQRKRKHADLQHR